MKNFFQKQREVVAMLTFVLIVFCLVWFVIMPLLKKIQTTNDSIQEENLKQESARQRLTQLPKIQQQFAMLEENANPTDVLLSKDKAIGLIELLEKVAADTNNKIEINVQDNVVKNVPVKNKAAQDAAATINLPSTDYLELKIKLTGQYSDVIKFVSKLESLQYYNDVISLDLSVHQEAKEVTNRAFNPFDGSDQKPNAVDRPANNGPLLLDASIDSVFYSQK